MQQRSIRYGIACALVANLAFPLHDAVVKWLVADYSVWQIMGIRSVLISIALLIWQGPGLLYRAALSPQRSYLLLRAIVLVAAWTLFYSAARYLGLGELTTLYFASPVLVACLAIVFLGERVSPAKWLAIALGFAGVLIASQPDLEMSLFPVLLALSAAVLWAIGVILIRKYGVHESSSVTLIVTNLGFVLLGGIMMPWWWKTPSLVDAGLFALSAVFAGIAQILVLEAIRNVPASTISPLSFSALIWAFGLGYLLWGERPGMTAFTGAGLIMLSGIWICILQWRHKASHP